MFNMCVLSFCNGIYGCAKFEEIFTYINVQPAFVLFANVSYFIDGIKSAEHCCSRGGVHEEGNVAFVLALHNQSLQLRRNHAPPKK